MRAVSCPGRLRLPRRAVARSGVGLLLSAVLGWTVASATPPSELRRVHALLVVDTLSDLGESVKVDGERIDHLLSNMLPKDRAEIVVLTGKDVNANAILSYFRGLRVGQDDALFFYYAGHGATDPQKGHFLALQELGTKPLLRATRRVMQEHQPGLVVIMTDCCSTRFSLGKTRRLYLDKGNAASIDPVLRCLLYQSRGLVDITAASGNASFGDDHEGGIFTRSFAKLVEDGIATSDANHDGFVSWPEFFSKPAVPDGRRVHHLGAASASRGEEVDQTSQKPMAFSLGTGGESQAVRLRNDTVEPMEYEYRWAGRASWMSGHLAPHAVAEHAPPADGGHTTSLEVRFRGGKTAELQAGKTYRFHDSEKTRDREKCSPPQPRGSGWPPPHL